MKISSGFRRLKRIQTPLDNGSSNHPIRFRFSSYRRAARTWNVFSRSGRTPIHPSNGSFAPRPRSPASPGSVRGISHDLVLAWINMLQSIRLSLSLAPRSVFRGGGVRPGINCRQAVSSQINTPRRGCHLLRLPQSSSPLPCMRHSSLAPWAP
jgi:hypothetical protein